MENESTRPWGRYEVLNESGNHKIKRIWVEPGKRLSLQRHKFRSEHWFIVSGVADVVVGEKKMVLQAGQSVDIAMGELHRIGNSGSSPVCFIEVQTGTYFGEDDIERLEDDFGRGA